MGWYILAQVLTILVSIVSIGRMEEQEKDLEILIFQLNGEVLPRAFYMIRFLHHTGC